MRNSISFSELFEEIQILNASLKTISVYDRSYNFLGGQEEGLLLPEQDILPELRITLQEELFSSSQSFRFIPTRQSQDVFVLMLSLIDTNADYSYAVLQFDGDFFDHIISGMRTDLRIRLLNSNFKIVSDTETLVPIVDLYINEISERALLGFTENRFFENERYSFSSLTMETEPLFVIVSAPADYNLAVFQTRRTLLVLLNFLVLFVGFAIGWVINRDIRIFGENILVSDRYTKDMRFFDRMLRSIDEIRKNLPYLQKTTNEIQFLYNDLETIKEKSPKGIADKKAIDVKAPKKKKKSQDKKGK